jgi:hypothetical protein
LRHDADHMWERPMISTTPRRRRHSIMIAVAAALSAALSIAHAEAGAR